MTGTQGRRVVRVDHRGPGPGLFFPVSWAVEGWEGQECQGVILVTAVPILQSKRP